MFKEWINVAQPFYPFSPSTWSCKAIYLRAPPSCDRRLSSRQHFEAWLRFKRIGARSWGLFFRRFHSAGGQYWSGLALFASQRPAPFAVPAHHPHGSTPWHARYFMTRSSCSCFIYIFMCLFPCSGLGGHFNIFSILSHLYLSCSMIMIHLFICIISLQPTWYLLKYVLKLNTFGFYFSIFQPNMAFWIYLYFLLLKFFLFLVHGAYIPSVPLYNGLGGHVDAFLSKSNIYVSFQPRVAPQRLLQQYFV